MKKRLIIVGSAVVGALLIAGGVFWWYQQRTGQQPSNDQAHSEQHHNPAPPPPTYTEQVLEKMSLREKVASLFILHQPGTDPAALASYLSGQQASGLIFMGDNVPGTLDELSAETNALINDKKLPPLMAVDEEGSTVRRLAADTYPGPLTLRNQPPQATHDAYAKRAELLQRVGLNLNFGIIADVTADRNSFIYPRVLGTTPQAASERVQAAVEGSKGKGVLSTLKHFPGHGETPDDSHTTIPVAPTTIDDWRNRVALPFKAGIDAGAEVVMFGHLRYTTVDQQPATLSQKWHDIIRNDLGFKGLIITDDMIMLQNSGEAAYADPVQNAIAAVQAGNDLLLYVLDHGGGASGIDPGTLIDGVVKAVNDGKIDASSIDKRVQKVLDARHQLSELSQQGG